ncbi:MAG: glycosyltransferase family 4 protein [Candidatus Harrisonbacteria bacterium]|nr:glycosyltransferase family 4 protein [Candidatus Harrisonbacteria bacterium]
MKILCFSSVFGTNDGYGQITWELTKEVSKHHEITLLVPPQKNKKEVNFEVKEILPEYIFDLKSKKILQYLFFDFDASGYDLIHSFFEFPYALIAAKLAKKYKKSLIIGTQGTYAIKPLFMFPEKYFLNWAYNTASMITAPSVFTRDHIQKFSPTKTPIQVIHNGLDFEKFQMTPPPRKKEYGDKKVLMTVGGLKARKGQDIVLRALGLLKKKRNDFLYILVGSGELRGKLEEITKEEKITENVIFAGEVNSDRVAEKFHECDIYVHTPVLGNWNFEGFGIVYLEAAACKKPIIASDSGGVKDAIIVRKTALLVKESDVIGTAGAIEALLDDEQLRKDMGEAGFAYAKAHDWSIITQEFLELYKKVAKG